MSRGKIEIWDKEVITRETQGRGRSPSQKLLNLLGLGNYEMRVGEASEIVGISKRTAYEWIKWWNEGGYKGMKRKKGGSGRSPRLGEEELEKLKRHFKEKEYWTTKEVKEEIKEEFGVELSEDQVRRILREKLRRGDSRNIGNFPGLFMLLLGLAGS